MYVSESRRHAIWLPLSIVVSTILWIAVPVYFCFVAGDAMTPEQFAATARSYGAWAVGFSILTMVLCALTPLPAEVPAIANGLVFGLVGGIVVTWIGGILGALLGFGLARALGRPAIIRFVPYRYQQKFERVTSQRGGHLLFAARCIPLVPFFVLNFASGLSCIRPWTYFWISALGILPVTILLVVCGEQLGSVLP